MKCLTYLESICISKSHLTEELERILETSLYIDIRQAYLLLFISSGDLKVARNLFVSVKN